MLGGSSGLNLMAWTRPSIAELDALDSFAPGSGWNWKGLLPYFIKSENVLSNQNNPFPGVAKVQKTNPAFEGQSGPVQVSR
jgi:choline dehydrogenase-like flavoprotein